MRTNREFDEWKFGIITITFNSIPTAWLHMLAIY